LGSAANDAAKQIPLGDAANDAAKQIPSGVASQQVPSAHGGTITVALQAIHIERALVIGVSTDILFPLTQQEQIAEGLRGGGAEVEFVALDSPQGHDAFLVDIANFGAAISAFLGRL
jgi:homoserine O-acetyltransferase